MIGHNTLRQLAHSTGSLLYLGFSHEVRLCSHSALHVLGQDWAHGDFSVGSVQVGQQGVSAITVTLGDMDFAWAWRLRTEFAPGILCQWHLLYRGAAGWETELSFSGALERPRIGKNGSVQIDAKVDSGATAVAPRIPHESRWSLPRGAEIVINGTTYQVDG